MESPKGAAGHRAVRKRKGENPLSLCVIRPIISPGSTSRIALGPFVNTPGRFSSSPGRVERGVRWPGKRHLSGERRHMIPARLQKHALGAEVNRSSLNPDPDFR